jgi:hypothetical protein
MVRSPDNKELEGPKRKVDLMRIKHTVEASSHCLKMSESDLRASP